MTQNDPMPQLRLNRRTRQAWIGDQNLDATDLTFHVLEQLAIAAPASVSLQDLKAGAWGLEVSDDAVKQRIKLIRKDLAAAGAEGLLTTERGRGYRLKHDALIEDSSPGTLASGELSKPPIRWLAHALTALLSLVFLTLLWASRTETSDGYSRVAIMPFTARGESAHLLAAGMELEIAAALARLDGFRAISRSSSHAMNGQRARDIRRQLGADAILEGHINDDGESYRLIIQLIDTKTEEQIWSSEYSRGESPENAILANIAVHIAIIVHDTRDPEMYQRMLAAPTSDVYAYEAYIQARSLLDRSDAGSLQAALARLEHALEIDPEFAMAQAWTGYTYARLAHLEGDTSLAQTALVFARQSLRQSPALAEGLLAQAAALQVLENDNQAETMIAQALATAPYLSDFVLN